MDNLTSNISLTAHHSVLCSDNLNIKHESSIQESVLTAIRDNEFIAEFHLSFLRSRIITKPMLEASMLMERETETETSHSDKTNLISCEFVTLHWYSMMFILLVLLKVIINIREVSPWYAGQVCDNVIKIFIWYFTEAWELGKCDYRCSIFSSSSCGKSCWITDQVFFIHTLILSVPHIQLLSLNFVEA